MKTPNDYNVPKWLRIIIYPMMIVGSALGTVAYVSTMALTLFVIQAIGLVLLVCTFLKYLYDLVLRLMFPEPVPWQSS